VTFTALLTECARRPGHAKAAARLLRALDDDDAAAATSSTSIAARANAASQSVASIVAANLIQAAPSSSSLRKVPQPSSGGTRAAPAPAAATDGATTAAVLPTVGAAPESTSMSLGAVLVSLFGEASRVEDAFFVVQKIAGLAAEASSSSDSGSSTTIATSPAATATAASAADSASASPGALDSSAAAATTLGDDAFQAALSTAFSAVDTAKRLDDAVELLDLLRAKNMDQSASRRFQDEDEASGGASGNADGVEGFRVNEVTYAALLGACGRVKRLATAFAVFQVHVPT